MMENRNTGESISIDEIQKNIRERIRVLSDKYSDQEIADKIHVNRSSVNNWYNGNKRASLQNVIALSQAYSIPIDEFLLGRKQISEDCLSMLGISQDHAEIIQLYRNNPITWYVLSFFLSPSGYQYLMFLCSMLNDSVYLGEDQVKDISTSFGRVSGEQILDSIRDQIILNYSKFLIDDLSRVYHELVSPNEKEQKEMEDLKAIMGLLSRRSSGIDPQKIKSLIKVSFDSGTNVLIKEFLSLNFPSDKDNDIHSRFRFEHFYESFLKLKDDDETLFNYALPLVQEVDRSIISMKESVKLAHSKYGDNLNDLEEVDNG